MKSKFIPGIYNYCDRWCERCDFTSRCRNYESTSKLSPEQLDMNNKAFWDNLSSNFTSAIKLLHKAARKHGIDLNAEMSPEEQVAYEKQEKLVRTASKKHVLSKLCKEYRQIAMPFVEKSEGMVDKTRELVEHLHLGMQNEKDVVYTMVGIGDCFEIIQWYLFFIDAKLHRALRGKMEGETWETENGFQKDSDGSAKIALIAIQKSTEAWARLHDQLPASEDTILAALSLLGQLKRKTSEEFPDAMQFKRAGFDD